jgi:hypothetical protein
MAAPARSKALGWTLHAILLRPGHLQLALWLLATVVYGVAAGVLLNGHPYVAGAVITAVWLAATWRGLRSF